MLMETGFGWWDWTRLRLTVRSVTMSWHLAALPRRGLLSLVGSGSVLDLAVLPGRDKYGRGLARFFVGGRNVAEILTSDGLARAYEGGRRQSWC